MGTGGSHAGEGGVGLRIGAVDDHPIILAGLGEALKGHLPRSSVRPVARTVAEFLALDPQVDVALLDVELHDGTDPADNVRALVAIGLPVILFTQDQRPHLVARAFRAGAAGLLSKSEEVGVIAGALAAAGAGEPYLSAGWAGVLQSDSAWATPNLAPREREAIRLYAAGMKLTTVARRLGVTEDTARTYLLRARNKYAGVGRPAHTKTDLYIRAIEDGLLPSPGPTGSAELDA